MGIIQSIMNKQKCFFMFGLDASGTTAILYKLKLGEVITTIPTIGFNIESVAVKNVEDEIIITDAAFRDKSRPLIRVYFENSYKPNQAYDGIVFVVDASDHDRIDAARDFMHYAVTHMKSWQSFPPLAILAHKQDIEEALSANEVEDRLGLDMLRYPMEYAVFETSITDGRGIHKAMEWLADPSKVEAPPKSKNTRNEKMIDRLNLVPAPEFLRLAQNSSKVGRSDYWAAVALARERLGYLLLQEGRFKNLLREALEDEKKEFVESTEVIDLIKGHDRIDLLPTDEVAGTLGAAMTVASDLIRRHHIEMADDNDDDDDDDDDDEKSDSEKSKIMMDKVAKFVEKVTSLDPSNCEALSRFQPIMQRSNCPFAKQALLWGAGGKETIEAHYSSSHVVTELLEHMKGINTNGGLTHDDASFSGIRFQLEHSLAAIGGDTSIEAQARVAAPSLAAFCTLVEAGEPLDGFLLWIDDDDAVTQGPAGKLVPFEPVPTKMIKQPKFSFGEGKAKTPERETIQVPSPGITDEDEKALGSFASTVRRALTALSDFDPAVASHRSMGASYIDSSIWRFEFCGVTFFVTTFAPCYPWTSPRYTHGRGDSFILLQPEVSFLRRGIPSVADDELRDKLQSVQFLPEQKPSGSALSAHVDAFLKTSPNASVRQQVQRAFASARRPFVVPELKTPMSHQIVRPLREHDDAVEWWKKCPFHKN